MIKEKDIEACFPELQWIEDQQLRQQVITVWKKAADRGHWTSLDDVPFTLLIDAYNDKLASLGLVCHLGSLDDHKLVDVT